MKRPTSASGLSAKWQHSRCGPLGGAADWTLWGTWLSSVRLGRIVFCSMKLWFWLSQYASFGQYVADSPPRESA